LTVSVASVPEADPEPYTEERNKGLRKKGESRRKRARERRGRTNGLRRASWSCIPEIEVSFCVEEYMRRDKEIILTT